MSHCKGFKRHVWTLKNGKVICDRCNSERNPKASAKMLRTKK